MGQVEGFTTLFETDESEPPVRRAGKPRKVRCSKRACTRTLRGGREARRWTSPKFPPEYGWLFSVYADGRSLPHAKTTGGCITTFRGGGVTATLNGCRGRFRLTYSGGGDFTVRWRVFETCKCAAHAGDHGRRRGLGALGLSRPAARRAFRTFR